MQSVLIATLIGAASAFQIAPLAAMRRAPIVVTMGLAEEAANCLEEGCSIDAVADLVSDLKNECVVLNQNGLAGSSRNQQARPLRAPHGPKHASARCPSIRALSCSSRARAGPHSHQPA